MIEHKREIFQIEVDDLFNFYISNYKNYKDIDIARILKIPVDKYRKYILDNFESAFVSIVNNQIRFKKYKDALIVLDQINSIYTLIILSYKKEDGRNE